MTETFWDLWFGWIDLSPLKKESKPCQQKWYIDTSKQLSKITGENLSFKEYEIATYDAGYKFSF